MDETRGNSQRTLVKSPPPPISKPMGEGTLENRGHELFLFTCLLVVLITLNTLQSGSELYLNHDILSNLATYYINVFSKQLPCNNYKTPLLNKIS